MDDRAAQRGGTRRPHESCVPVLGAAVRAKLPPRILARALNCLNLGADGEPCGTCENCVAVADGTFYLVELDGVEQRCRSDARPHPRRASRSRRIQPAQGVHRRRGAHALGGRANTLLKTLEEPPAHVVFVLASPTRKRCCRRSARTQHFESTLLSHEQLVGHLTDILVAEGIDADAEALDIIARRAAGSARRAVDARPGARHRRRPARRATGADRAWRCAVRATSRGARCRCEGRRRRGARRPARHGRRRPRPRRAADDLLRTMRDVFLLANAGGRAIRRSVEEAAQLARSPRNLAATPRPCAIEILGQAIVDIRGKGFPTLLVLEVPRSHHAPRSAREETLLDRAERLEEKPANGAPAIPPAPAAAPQAAPATAPPPDPRGRCSRAAVGGRRQERKCPTNRRPSRPRKQQRKWRRKRRRRRSVSTTLSKRGRKRSFLKAPLRAAIQDAQLIAIDGMGVIVFGVPKPRFQAINDRFRKEAGAIKEAFAKASAVSRKPFFAPGMISTCRARMSDRRDRQSRRIGRARRRTRRLARPRRRTDAGERRSRAWSTSSAPKCWRSDHDDRRADGHVQADPEDAERHAGGAGRARELDHRSDGGRRCREGKGHRRGRVAASRSIRASSIPAMSRRSKISWSPPCRRQCVVAKELQAQKLGAAHRRLDLDSMLGGLGGLPGS